ncbi:MAG: ATP-binding cassette domain-containing protein [Verrucomicrobiae bacterium]|nr:ATP-binding cassette domain-containing protein [Verrucomicrobiae bacterium]
MNAPSTLSADNILEFQQARLGYPQRAILERVDFSIPRSSFTVLSGENGSGKTTLLKTIGGLLPLLAGTMASKSTRRGYVPQFDNMDASFPVTAMEMVGMGAAAAFPWWRTIFGGRRQTCREYLRQCQADRFAGQMFSQLSGGQRQRVLLARALAAQPDFLLLDEPTAGVDLETQKILIRLLGHLRRDSGMTVIAIVHHPEIFEGIATHHARVADGAVCMEPWQNGRAS